MCHFICMFCIMSLTGVLYHRWGKNEQAEEAYLKAIELDPVGSSARDNLQKLHRKMGKDNS